MKIKIGEIRNKKGKSLRWLVIHTSIPRSTLSEYENHRKSPRMEHMERIARALGVTISELYDSKYK